RGVSRRVACAAASATGAGTKAWTHPGSPQHPLGQGGRSGNRRVPPDRAAPFFVRGSGPHPRSGGGSVLPDRRTQRPYLVRPPRTPRLPQSSQLRRLVDRMGFDGRSPDRALTRGGAGRRATLPRSVRLEERAPLGRRGVPASFPQDGV